MDEKINTLKKNFLNPDKQYTPFPFWFWNDKFSEAEISRQMYEMKEKGIDGFVLHPRIGIPETIPYLGTEFFHYVKFGIALAKKLEMKVLLYDEGMYPSGSANGQVVKTYPEYASKGIYVSKRQDFQIRTDRFQQLLGFFNWDDNANKAHFITDKEEAQYVLVHEDSMGTIRGIHFGEDDGEKAAPRSTDLLNSKACQLFIRFTHDKYYSELKSYFGSTIIGFFTDEPDILGRNHPENMLPFNDELALQLANYDITIADLPNLFFGNDKKMEEHYQECVTMQLQKSYYQPISEWCTSHNIVLTGHPHDAHDIGMLKNFQIPGQDIVWRWVAPENDLGVKGRESVTAKCSADAARHSESSRNASECFGCCGPAGIQWAFSTDDMKWYLDWLFTRGVNFIIPHAFFYSHNEKQLEDRPPDVGLNNLWWNDYAYFSSYIKRMSYMMSDQINLTNIAILTEKNRLPYDGVEHLIQNQIEFNYLEDTYLFNNDFSVSNGILQVAKQKYSLLIVDQEYPKKQKIRKILRSYMESGGSILFLTDDKTIFSQLDSIAESYTASVKLSGTQLKDLRYSEFIKNSEKFILLGNEGEQEIRVLLNFSEKTSNLEIWDTWSGAIDHVSLIDGKTELVIPRRTILLLHQNEYSNTTVKEAIPCMRRLPKYQVTSDQRGITELGDWTMYDGYKYFSGTVTYYLRLDPTEVHDFLDKPAVLNLGSVKNIAALYIDSQKIETRFWAPYRFKLPAGSLNKLIEIRITNTLANQKERVALESGLMGPITVET